MNCGHLVTTGHISVGIGSVAYCIKETVHWCLFVPVVVGDTVERQVLDGHCTDPVCIQCMTRVWESRNGY
jgi:hypothetical protein